MSNVIKKLSPDWLRPNHFLLISDPIERTSPLAQFQTLLKRVGASTCIATAIVCLLPGHALTQSATSDNISNTEVTEKEERPSKLNRWRGRLLPNFQRRKEPKTEPSTHGVQAQTSETVNSSSELTELNDSGEKIEDRTKIAGKSTSGIAPNSSETIAGTMPRTEGSKKPKKKSRFLAYGSRSEKKMATVTNVTSTNLNSNGSIAHTALAEKSEIYIGFNKYLDSIDTAVVRNVDAMHKNTDISINYSTDQMTESWINYLALAAISSEDFKKGVTEIKTHYGLERAVLGLTNDVSYASKLSGADQATQKITSLIHDHTRGFSRMGNNYKNLSYDLQDLGWAKKNMTKQSARATQLKNLDRKSRTFNINHDISSIIAAKLGEPAHNFTQTHPPKLQPTAMELNESVTNKALTLAALDLLGVLNTLPTHQSNKLNSDRKVRSCLSRMKLNMYQCIAAGKFHYEEAFCVSEHAMKETGYCLATGARH